MDSYLRSGIAGTLPVAGGYQQRSSREGWVYCCGRTGLQLCGDRGSAGRRSLCMRVLSPAGVW